MGFSELLLSNVLVSVYNFNFIPFHYRLSCMFSSVFYVFFGELDNSSCKSHIENTVFFFFFFSSVEVWLDKLLSEPSKKTKCFCFYLSG